MPTAVTPCPVSRPTARSHTFPPLQVAPQELKGITVEQGPDIGFVNFTLFPRHFAADKRERSIVALVNFRNYLHYHIKCSKAYMHMRMRKRVTMLLQILNRAKPEASGGEKKTASGRTFVRK